MTRPATKLYVLPAAAAEDLAWASFGKLRALRAEAGAEQAFILFDCFDRSVQASGRMLLEVGPAFELLTGDGENLTQTAQRQGDFVADFAEGPVKQALADLSGLRRLLRLGAGTLRAERLVLVNAAGKPRCRARLHLLTTEEGGALLVSLQGLPGYDKARDRLRRRIEAAGGRALAETDPAALLFPARPPYVAKPEIEIGPKESAFDIAARIIAAHIPVARANEAGIIADLDTEFLHDYRIALRKIRSVLSLFTGVYAPGRTTALKARFSALMAPTGRLRDLDVYLLEREKYYGLLPDDLQAGLDILFDGFEAERAAEQARLAHHLQSERYAQVIEALAEIFAKHQTLEPGPRASWPARVYARALIWKRYRRLCKSAAGIGPGTSDAEIHQLRIHCKKLRYLMEFFAPVFPARKLGRLIKPLKRLQDALGYFNDTTVQQRSLQALLDGQGAAEDAAPQALEQSVRALIPVLHAQQLEARAEVMRSFAHFHRPRRRATFRKLFKPGKH